MTSVRRVPSTGNRTRYCCAKFLGVQRENSIYRSRVWYNLCSTMHTSRWGVSPEIIISMLFSVVHEIIIK
jgi:hypothetical protein